MIKVDEFSNPFTLKETSTNMSVQKSQLQSSESAGHTAFNFEGSWATIRKAQGVCLEDIEKQTSIPLKKLEALEGKDFERVGGDTFTKGYIRRYAKVVGLDAEPYLAIYSQFLADLEAQAIEAIPAAKKNKLQKRKQKGLVKSSVSMRETSAAPVLDRPAKKGVFSRISFFHIILAVVALWVAFTALSGDEITPVAPGAESLEVDEHASLEATAEELELGLEEEGLAASGITTEVITSVIADNEEEAGLIEQEASNSIDELSLIDTDLPSSTSSAESTTSSIESTLSPVEPEPIVTGSVENDDGEDLVVMSFTGDCWVSVKDATSKVLFAELQTKGDNLQLFGQAPFEVMLGDARAVHLLVNGRVVSTEPKGNKKTLKLVVTR